MKIGYLGPKGTFSDEAASRYFVGPDMELIAYATIPDVLEDIQEGTLAQGIVPIENTIEGSINLTIDGLTEHQDLFVCGEVTLSVSLQLLGLADAAQEGIREVWSISPALSQCHRFLRKLQADVQSCDSTAAAAAKVRTLGRLDVGAIASRFAAKEFGLQILASDIQDTQLNHTRFVVVTKGVHPPADPQKTMLLVTPSEEHAGMLADILQAFATFDLNLQWIESRPTKTKLGTYQFYMDVETGLSDSRLAKAIAIVEILGHNVRMLGSYRGSAY